MGLLEQQQKKYTLRQEAIRKRLRLVPPNSLGCKRKAREDKADLQDSISGAHSVMFSLLVESVS